MTSKREVRGIDLVAKGYLTAINSKVFVVKSEHNPKLEYTVKWEKKRWTCTCVDFEKRQRKCKHIYAVCHYLSLRDMQIGIKRVTDENPKCPSCGRKDSIIKDGKSESRSGLIQRFYCKKCKQSFSPRTGFEGAHGQGFAIVLSLDLYYRGLSLRQIAEHFQSVYSITISHGTIYGWIKKYVQLVSECLKSKKVTTSERWHADETVVRVKGHHMRLWAMIDSEFRQLIGKHLSESRAAPEAVELLEQGIAKSKELPSEIVTDCAPAYIKAIDQKFGEDLKQPIIHVQSALSSPLTNNRIERFNRTFKQRFKTISSFHNEETAKTFVEGFTIFYNEIKKHRSLGGKTPATAADSNAQETNWIKLIQKTRE